MEPPTTNPFIIDLDGIPTTYCTLPVTVFLGRLPLHAVIVKGLFGKARQWRAEGEEAAKRPVWRPAYWELRHRSLPLQQVAYPAIWVSTSLVIINTSFRCYKRVSRLDFGEKWLSAVPGSSEVPTCWWRLDILFSSLPPRRRGSLQVRRQRQTHKVTHGAHRTTHNHNMTTIKSQ